MCPQVLTAIIKKAQLPGDNISNMDSGANVKASAAFRMDENLTCFAVRVRACVCARAGWLGTLECRQAGHATRAERGLLPCRPRPPRPRHPPVQDVTGGCERILRTPVPLMYTRHNSRFLMIWFAAAGLWGCGAVRL